MYTLKEMLTQTDRHEFIKVMYEGVDSLFKEKTWNIPRKLMEEHYKEEREKVKEAKKKNYDDMVNQTKSKTRWNARQV